LQRRGARLTHQLLAFSRKQHLAPTSLDLNRLVSDALLFRTIGATVRIETMLTEGLWPALVDPTRIELVLLNLAINSQHGARRGDAIRRRSAHRQSRRSRHNGQCLSAALALPLGDSTGA
jgi:nitrogen fixation/metabolism regulation signal transduction histidine kinase